MNKFQFKKKLSRKSAAEKSAAAATTSEATGSAGESLLRVAREMSNAMSVKETQSQGSEDQEAAGSIQAPNPEGESQEFQIPPSGTVARSVSPTPPPPSDHLDKVTLAFVYELVKEVVPKFLSLAAVEERLTEFESMVKGQTPIAPELRIERKLPHLAPGCKFSVRARAEVGNMFKAHDLEYVTRLRDDLQDKVIPSCEAEIELVLSFARNKLEAECPAEELHAARQQFEKEMEKKREKRAQLLKQKVGASAASKKGQLEKQQPEQQAKQPRREVPPPQWWGPPQQQHNHWKQRRGFEDPHVRAGWREPPVRGRGRGRGRRF